MAYLTRCTHGLVYNHQGGYLLQKSKKVVNYLTLEKQTCADCLNPSTATDPVFEHTCAHAQWAHMHRFLSVTGPKFTGP